MRARIWLAVLNRTLLAAASIAVLAVPGRSAQAQRPPSGPPAVGVVRVERTAVTETNEFVGRIQSTNRVALVARVNAFLEKQLFTEGAEVNAGDILYVLEQPPFEADVEAKEAAVAQAKAQLENANITLARAEALIRTPAGQQSNVDNARATQLSDAAQVLAAQAQLTVSQINLGYTEIKAPITGKIGRTAITIGNYVTPSSGTLTTIVSQDPMYVVFAVSNRMVIDLRERYANQGGLAAQVIKLRLPDGRPYGQVGHLNFVDNTVSSSTDTLILRGTVPNPSILPGAVVNARVRELTDGEFVTVLLEGVEPVEALTIPRAAVLSDQQGNYVFTVDAQNKAQQARIVLGQSTPTTAVVASGLQEGQLVVVDGVQRVRPGAEVTPGPASPQPGVTAAEAAGGASPGASTGGAGTPAASGATTSGATAGGATAAGSGSGGAAR
jgi:membrane fusion protein, multidrug efflux system